MSIVPTVNRKGEELAVYDPLLWTFIPKVLPGLLRKSVPHSALDDCVQAGVESVFRTLGRVLSPRRCRSFAPPLNHALELATEVSQYLESRRRGGSCLYSDESAALDCANNFLKRPSDSLREGLVDTVRSWLLQFSVRMAMSLRQRYSSRSPSAVLDQAARHAYAAGFEAPRLPLGASAADRQDHCRSRQRLYSQAVELHPEFLSARDRPRAVVEVAQLVFGRDSEFTALLGDYRANVGCPFNPDNFSLLRRLEALLGCSGLSLADRGVPPGDTLGLGSQFSTPSLNKLYELLPLRVERAGFLVSRYEPSGAVYSAEKKRITFNGIPVVPGDRDFSQPAESVGTARVFQREDSILLTVLPNFSDSRRRCVLLCGANGLGTRFAYRVLLDRASRQWLSREIRRSSCFQAFFQLRVCHDHRNLASAVSVSAQRRLFLPLSEDAVRRVVGRFA